MNSILNLIRSKFSLLILLIPYISIINYDYFPLIGLPLFLISFLFIDFYLFNKIDKKYILIIYIILTYFFYSLLIFKDSLYIIHELRFREFSFIFLIITSIYYYLIIYKFSLIKYQNVFLYRLH